MKKYLYLSFLVFIVFGFFCFTQAYGDELDDINKQLNELNTAYNQSKAATAPLESQLKGIKERVAFIEADVIKKKKEINNEYENLAKKKTIFDKTVSKNYIESYNNNLLSSLIGSQATDIIQNLAYQKAKADQDKVIITNIALSITDLEEKKRNLESEEARLAEIKIKLDKVVSEAKAYQATLSTKIAALSARQKQILNERLASLNIPLYAISGGGCSSDLTNGKNPGFSGGFGLFTYGVPNRVGLNQYGALGRAKANKNFDEILHAYYDFNEYKNNDDVTINVNDSNGYNSGNIIWSGPLNDYVKKIYEVPGDWPYESIKAQVIAARSYVIAATNNGVSSICATQYCQVFKKDGTKGGTWDQAVNDSERKVMVKDGQVVKAFFSSTHGGYAFNTGDLVGWSTTSYTKRMIDTPSGSVSSFDDLKNNAYDKDSPWFYCDWGSRSSHGGTAWLAPGEFADIVNSILLVQSDSSADSHILQTDKSYSDAWSEDKVKQELSRYRTPFNNISSGRVDVDFGNGKTTRIYFSGDAGSVDFPADVFKKYFNLRAPANIQIVGPLYNIERN
jgi:SpoIID/LytB domain protein